MPLHFTLLAALLSSTPPIAVEDEQARRRPDADVVVTATRLTDSEQALKACVARKCSPKEDVAATLEHAKNLFITGNYRSARSVLQASRSRNFRYRAEQPELISFLLSANATVAGHLGEGESARFESIVSLDILKDAFSANDPRVLKGRLELAYQRLRAGDFDEAITQFQLVENAAQGQPEILGHTLLTEIMIVEKLTPASRIGYSWLAERAKKKLLTADEPAFARYVATLRIFEGRKAAERGDRVALDTALAAYSRYAAAATQPVLIFRPTVDLSAAGAASADATANNAGFAPVDVNLSADSALLTQSQAQFEKEWIDVGYWINADGSVRDPEVLRASSNSERYWQKPLLKAVSGRRYAPYDVASVQFAPFRIERFTYIADFGNASHSRVRLRTGRAKIESVDLTASKPATPKDKTDKL